MTTTTLNIATLVPMIFALIEARYPGGALLPVIDPGEAARLRGSGDKSGYRQVPWDEFMLMAIDEKRQEAHLKHAPSRNYLFIKLAEGGKVSIPQENRPFFQGMFPAL